MSQARIKLPEPLEALSQEGWLYLLNQANLGIENLQIALLYYIDKLPQIDIAAAMYMDRSTVSRRLKRIRRKVLDTAGKYHIA